MAHSVGRDVIFGLSFFIGAGEIQAICRTVGQVGSFVSKAAPVLQNLKWVRQAAGNLVPGLILCAGLDLGSPMVNSLVRIGTNPATNKIELVVKAGAWDDALVDLSGAVVQFDAPAELMQGGRRLVKQPGDGVQLPLRVVEQGTGRELAVSAATQQYQLSHYLDEAGKSVLLISRALDGGGSGNSDCEVCNNRSVAALYRTVCERAGGTLVAEAGLNRICERVTDDSRLQAMGEEWLGWNATSLNAFFGDVTQAGAGSNHIASRLAELTLGWVKAWEVLHTAGKVTPARNTTCLQLFEKLDANNFSVLKTNLLSSLNDAKLIEFGDDFGETIVETLQRMDNDISIFHYWRMHKQEFLTPYVTNVGDIPSVATVAASFQGNPEIIALINAVDAAPLPSNSQFVMAGCHHPSLVNAYQIKYNFTSASADYQAFLNSCHPLLRDRIKYMDMIRNEFVADPQGTAYVRLINIDDLDKLTFAGEAGRHAELQSLSETLYRIEQAEHMALGTFPKSRLSEVSIFVKNKNGNVMQRCPCCFHGSHDHNVNMINLPGND